ncbi:MAG: hypothetical protein V3U75_05545 [Methylococcaceae bacterium]
MHICIEHPISEKLARQRSIPEKFDYFQVGFLESNSENMQIVVWFTNVGELTQFGEDKRDECLGENVRLFVNTEELVNDLQYTS